MSGCVDVSILSFIPSSANCCALCTTTAINGPGFRKPLDEDVNTLMQRGSAEIVINLATVCPALSPLQIFIL